jgi:hypothetical protein
MTTAIRLPRPLAILAAGSLALGALLGTAGPAGASTVTPPAPVDSAATPTAPSLPSVPSAPLRAPLVDPDLQSVADEQAAELRLIDAGSAAPPVTAAADAAPVEFHRPDGGGASVGPVEFAGRGEPGARIVLRADPVRDAGTGATAPPRVYDFETVVRADGSWSVVGETEPGVFRVTATQRPVGGGPVTTSATDLLAAPYPPVITSPAVGAQVAGQVDVRGTAGPDREITVTLQGPDGWSHVVTDTAADGTFAVTLPALAPGSYLTTARVSDLRDLRTVVSLESAGVPFDVPGVLPAEAVSDGPTAGPGKQVLSAGGQPADTTLALTGADSLAWILAAPAVVLAGLALVLVARRRSRAHG